MSYVGKIKPVSYLKANAAEMLRELADEGMPVVITQNGEARAVLQGVASYERTQEMLALLKLLALGAQDIAAGRTTSAREAIAALRRPVSA